MKKIMLLLITVLVISYLSSPPVLAAPRSYESRTVVIMRIVYHQIFGLGVSAYHGRDFVQIIIDDSGEPRLQGDADDLGGGKMDDGKGDEGVSDLKTGINIDTLKNLKISVTR